MGGRERGKDGMPHERENTRTGREKSFHSFICYCVGIVFLIWKPYIPGNYCQARLSRQPAHSDGLHVPPPPPFLNPSKRKNISLESSEILNVNTGEFFPMNLSTLVYMQLLFYSVESLCISGE
jgi:hypothetical protein